MDIKKKDYETKLRELHAETEQLGQTDNKIQNKNMAFVLPSLFVNDELAALEEEDIKIKDQNIISDKSYNKSKKVGYY